MESPSANEVRNPLPSASPTRQNLVAKKEPQPVHDAAVGVIAVCIVCVYILIVAMSVLYCLLQGIDREGSKTAFFVAVFLPWIVTLFVLGITKLHPGLKSLFHYRNKPWVLSWWLCVVGIVFLVLVFFAQSLPDPDEYDALKAGISEEISLECENGTISIPDDGTNYFILGGGPWRVSWNEAVYIYAEGQVLAASRIYYADNGTSPCTLIPALYATCKGDNRSVTDNCTETTPSAVYDVNVRNLSAAMDVSELQGTAALVGVDANHLFEFASPDVASVQTWVDDADSDRRLYVIWTTSGWLAISIVALLIYFLTPFCTGECVANCIDLCCVE